VAEVPELAVSVERLHRTVAPDSARFAGAELVNQALTASRDDVLASAEVSAFEEHLCAVFHEVGFDEQVASIYNGVRLHHPMEDIADLIVQGLETDADGASVALFQAVAQSLVEARRVDDLKRAADALRAVVPAADIEASCWTAMTCCSER
jgi:hypothetical protein